MIQYTPTSQLQIQEFKTPFHLEYPGTASAPTLNQITLDR